MFLASVCFHIGRGFYLGWEYHISHLIVILNRLISSYMNKPMEECTMFKDSMFFSLHYNSKNPPLNYISKKIFQ